MAINETHNGRGVIANAKNTTSVLTQFCKCIDGLRDQHGGIENEKYADGTYDTNVMIHWRREQSTSTQ